VSRLVTSSLVNSAFVDAGSIITGFSKRGKLENSNVSLVSPPMFPMYLQIAPREFGF